MALGASVCIEDLRSSMAFATSVSVDPNRSPMTLMACLIAVVIFVICSAGVMRGLRGSYELRAGSRGSSVY